MDYKLFANVIEWINSNGYTCMGRTDDEEIYYGKTKEAFNLENGIKCTSDFIKFPQISSSLYSNDFLIITTQIYKEDENLQMCVDVDECDFTDKPEIINIRITNCNEPVNIKKYFSQTFIDYKLENLDLMIDDIAKKSDFAITKLFDEPSDDNLVFVQINVVMSTRLSKYIKTDRCDIFFMNGNFLAKKKGDHIKNYLDVSTNPQKQQTEMIDILNSYYENLTIIKKPYTNEIIFGIKGQEFLKKLWNKYEGKFYVVMNEAINL